VAAVFVALLLGLIATGYAAKVAFDQKARAEAGQRRLLAESPALSWSRSPVSSAR
jgi:hypothetical protein